ncbi:phosphatase [[Clostridium] sordellii]|uniref:Stp1/IreP family PP2C-type Ser/Thr phosphatase n=1 Tax=Paraclostridium sordellii TaxID=1505 RepID=UPI0005DC27FE|nr:Stp1/IreP family PP2C-type Ser/Thr phosphatase [Paeniclostridium sordellii]MBX9180948.1 Stp1/IreP family PP2C-type Ser/Thr phosphatase [Paeniclostridium sordellii]CEO13213.1 phosphatase [[Clostridium] sordellii] [Paeniclostridium sordellii]
MIYSCVSHIGKIRKNNEDFCKGEIISTDSGEIGIFAIADGMGGHNKGEVASELAVENIVRFLKNNLVQNENVKINYIDDILKQAYNNVNSIIYKQAKEDEGCSGMGTTLTTVIIYKNKAYIANVGDSRCYLLQNSEFRKITRDHSLVEELVASHAITEEEAKTHPKRNVITRALGTEKLIIVDIYKNDIFKGDKILLATDGLTSFVEKEDIEKIISSDNSLEETTDSLINKANEVAGKDNVSVILIKYE